MVSWKSYKPRKRLWLKTVCWLCGQGKGVWGWESCLFFQNFRVTTKWCQIKDLLYTNLAEILGTSFSSWFIYLSEITKSFYRQNEIGVFEQLHFTKKIWLLAFLLLHRNFFYIPELQLCVILLEKAWLRMLFWTQHLPTQMLLVDQLHRLPLPHSHMCDQPLGIVGLTIKMTAKYRNRTIANYYLSKNYAPV